MSKLSDRVPDQRRVSLVIPVRDEAATMHELLASVSSQTRRPDEVLLVDGGSKDNTVALAHAAGAQDPSLRVIEAGEATPGRGRNVGIAAASYEWIALTDAGIRLEPDWLEQLLEVAQHDPSVMVVYGDCRPLTETFFERCAALAYTIIPQPRPGGMMRAPSIASSLLRREVWQAVGGFPDLRAAEDLILMEAVEQRGFKTGWAANAHVWWRLPPTLAGTFRKFVLYSRHNVWAGRQKFWHYGIARQYLLALLFIGLALVHHRGWLVLPALGLCARTLKSIWQRRDGRGLWWALNPAQFCGVMLVILTIDVATYLGWAQARLLRPPAAKSKEPSPTPSKSAS